MLNTVDKLQNIIILANSFNPSIFSQQWFIKNNIFEEGDFLPNCIFSQDIVQVVTNELSILIFPNQMICNLVSNYEEKSLNVIIKCVSLLPHVPYHACGINFNYFTDNGDESSINRSRDLFYFQESILHKEFNEDNARFGIYLSKDFENSRLKLDIKPNHIPIPNSTDIKKVLNFSFNFHKDFSGEKIYEDLIIHLNKWNKYRDYSTTLLNKLDIK